MTHDVSHVILYERMNGDKKIKNGIKNMIVIINENIYVKTHSNEDVIT